MDRSKLLHTFGLAQTFLLAFGFLNGAMGQSASIVKAVPEISERITSRLVVQDPVPDPQQSPSDQIIQDLENSLKSLQKLDNEALTKSLGNQDDIARLFELGQWPRKGISDISLDVREKSENAPEDIAAKLVVSQAGRWSAFQPTTKVFAWAAPDIRYQPLYFQNVPLERYGQTKAPYLETVHSAAHFFTSIALLPYHMHRDNTGSCDYPLGFCRPGDIVPCTIQRQLYPHTNR